MVSVTFIFIAGILLGVAASVAGFFGVKWWRTGVPLQWREISVKWRQPYLLAGTAIVCFVAAAAIIYLAVGAHRSKEGTAAETHPAGSAMSASSGATPASNGAMPAPGDAGKEGAKSMDADVAQLATRLAKQGGSDGDWTLLAQAYEFLGRPEDAKRARAHMASPTTTPVGQMSAAALVATADATAGNAGGTTANAVAPAAVPPTSIASPADLERRVKTNPRDAQAWLALADLKRGQRDYAGARAAYAKVIDLKAMSAQSWADYADVLGSLSGSLSGEPAKAIDQALALDAQNVKALWLRASLAHEQHNEADALKWWQKLRAVLPSDSPDAKIVDANMAEAASLAGVTLPAASASQVTAMKTAAPTSSAPGAELSGTVSLDTRFANRVQPDATLFVYAKAVDSPGPPLAVWRTTAGKFPVSFRLDDSMAMIPSRRLSQFDKVVVEARISRSGQAMPSAGDLYVTSPVIHPSGGQKLALVINREIG